MSTGSLSDIEEDFGTNEADILQALSNEEYNAIVNSQNNRIAEIQNQAPLLSSACHISELIPNYQGTVVTKLNNLIETRHTHCHRSRGDGNCFYRCYAFGL